MIWDPGGTINTKTFRVNRPLSRQISVFVDVTSSSLICDGSHTELDSHTNMLVVRKNVCILANTGRCGNVYAFSPDYKSRSIAIVNAAI